MKSRKSIQFLAAMLTVLLGHAPYGHSGTVNRPVRSFDCFDTLVGRLHGEPQTIFAAMEKELSYPGLMSLRMRAEREAPIKTLDGIYRTMQRIAGFSDERRDQLRAFELATEMAHHFPIMPNIARVRDGDIVVTDTSFTEQEIRQILSSIGLKKNIEVFATCDGKASGKIWDTLKQKKRIKFHLGDNHHSDVNSPRNHGIEAFHFPDASYSPNEEMVRSRGHHELSALMRALRLQNPYPPKSQDYAVWDEQTQFNIPILIFASQYLDAFCQQNHFDKILFSQRDCCHWIEIFRTLFPRYQSISFVTSRNLYYQASQEYHTYVTSLYKPNTLIVDLCGGGISITYFFKKKMSCSPNFFILTCGHENFPHLYTVKTSKIEQLNYDSIGSAIGFTATGPVRATLEYDSALVRPAFECIELCLSLLPKYPPPSLDKDLATRLGNKLEEHSPVLAKYHQDFHPRMLSHKSNE